MNRIQEGALVGEPRSQSCHRCLILVFEMGSNCKYLDPLKAAGANRLKPVNGEFFFDKEITGNAFLHSVYGDCAELSSGLDTNIFLVGMESLVHQLGAISNQK